ncbi:hypothetical protein HU200_062619 [Digitaria exilis]|uniref:GPN-loop GTPase 2 n=1 Tax=Digitaria exilis TaxID=1010633 RepID=A0A835AAL4_9POAL|nr:hypothetical protein HU200_062619 [Digitaria exilis]
MVFGQVVIGPPGSGKTTYCNGMSQFLSLLGRKVAVVNLDPANDALPYPLICNSNVSLTVLARYECAINIEDLIKLSDVMAEHSLGPNGGLVYCMDYLEKNIDWLEEKLKPLIEGEYRQLTAVHLIDAHLCCDPGKYDKESVGNLVKLIDKSNGYIFSSIDSSAVEFSKIAAAPLDWDYYRYPLLDLLIIFSKTFFIASSFYAILIV